MIFPPLIFRSTDTKFSPVEVCKWGITGFPSLQASTVFQSICFMLPSNIKSSTEGKMNVEKSQPLRCGNFIAIGCKEEEHEEREEE